MKECKEIISKFNITTKELDEILNCVNKNANEELIENMMEIRQLKEAMTSFIVDTDNGSNSNSFIFRHYEAFKDLLK